MSKRRPIPGFEHYEVSDDGMVFRVFGGKGAVVGRGLKQALRNGYPRVVLYTGRKSKNFYVHRAVALAFIPNPDGLPQVNHKDGDRTHNDASNLEWCSSSHNHHHAHYSLGVEFKDSEKRPVIGMNLASGEIISMPSVQEAARHIKGYHSAISKVCRGKRNHHKGWTFRYTT